MYLSFHPSLPLGSGHSELRYKPWGETRYSAGAPPTQRQFTGQINESQIGLYFFNARWYDPALGRFTSADSLVPEAGNPQAWDRYAFVYNNPMRYVDPSGYDPCLPKLYGYMVDGDDKGINLSVSHKNDTSGPFKVGIEWLSGEGARRHVFIDDDPFTELLKQHKHFKDVRELISRRLWVGDFGSYREDYYLGGLQGIPKYVQDYSTLLTFGLTGNLAVTFLGSYRLKYFVKNVDLENRQATILFYVYNESTLASATHPPVLGYTQFWEDNITLIVNRLVPEGPMSATTQFFFWIEIIPFP